VAKPNAEISRFVLSSVDATRYPELRVHQKKYAGRGAVRTFPVYVLEQAYRLVSMICQALAPLAFGRNEQLWNGSLWRILLKKSFPADERIFLEPLMGFARRDVRDHNTFQKNDHGPSYRP
jgi:hypothetical protein